MFSALKLAKDEPPVASVYLTEEHLNQALRLILGKPGGGCASTTASDELTSAQRPDGSWLPEQLEALGCINSTALTAFLVTCGVDRFHPQVLDDLRVAFATLVGFHLLLMSGGYGPAHTDIRELRDQLTEATLDAAELAFKWLMAFGYGYPEMPTRLGLAPDTPSLCAVLRDALASLQP